MTDKKDKKPTGVEPKRVKIDMDWEDAMGKALNKERPKEGWPKAEKDEKKRRLAFIFVGFLRYRALFR